MLTVELTYDPDIDCPADDCTWTLYSFGRRHSTYKDPDELGLGPLSADGTPKVYDPELRAKLEKGLAFWLSYFEHGSCLWFLRGDQTPPGVEFQWDGRRLAGLLVWEHPEDHIGGKTLEERRADARGFLEEYTAWCNGEGLGYTITDDNGEYVDSGCGSLSPEHIGDMAAETLAGKEFIVTGEAAEYEDILRERVRLLEVARANKE